MPTVEIEANMMKLAKKFNVDIAEAIIQYVQAKDPSLSSKKELPRVQPRSSDRVCRT